MGLIPDEIVAQVIDRSDIVEVVSSYIPLKRAGRNFKANCPFHNEKTPSFVVNPDKQIYHCFGCSAGGNVISFVMKQDHMQFPEAVRFLAKRVNIEIPETSPTQTKQSNQRQAVFHVNKLAAEYFHQNLISDKSAAANAAREYLKARDLSLETAKQFQLGFALDQWDGLINHLRKEGISLGLLEKAGLVIPRERKDGYYDRFRNRIVFPILDTREQSRAFGARALDNSTAKYINSPETIVYTKGHHLYGFYLAKKAIAEKDCVVVVEGYMDCIIPWQFGVNNIVASLGTALTAEQIRLIRRYTKNVTMLFDTDEAGIAAMNRSLDALLEEGIHITIAELEKGYDPDSYVRQYGKQAFEQRITEAKPVYDYKFEFLVEKFDKDTPQGKAKIAGEMLPMIYRFKDGIIRSEYRKRLAQQLHITEELLIKEYNKLAGKAAVAYHGEKKKPDATLRKQIRSVESNILKLLLHDEQFVAQTKGEIELTDFEDENIRTVISKIFDLFDQGHAINEAALINSLEQDSLKNIVSELMVNDEPFIEKEKMHSDFMARIKTDRIKNLKKNLREEIREAEQSGDHKRLIVLTEKFNQLRTQ